MDLTFPQLLAAYLDSLKGRPCYPMMRSVASHWLATLPTMPTRKQVSDRQRAICAGHFKPGAAKANKELGLLRAACHWGIDEDLWAGGDPTLRIKKWRTAERTRTGKLEELRTLLHHFDFEVRQPGITKLRIGNRALFGLMLFTGCRPSEARTAPLSAITPYGEMGCWMKGRTKNGRTQEVPLPSQYMRWLAAWVAIRPRRSNPYLFPGYALGAPITIHNVLHRWDALCGRLKISGLWNYDLRRTLTCTLGNEFHVDDHTLRAILNHYEGSALGHYYFKSFDSLTAPIQAYADWLCALKQAPLVLSRRIGAPRGESKMNGASGRSRYTSATATAVLDEGPHPHLLNGRDAHEEWPG